MATDPQPLLPTSSSANQYFNLEATQGRHESAAGDTPSACCCAWSAAIFQKFDVFWGYQPIPRHKQGKETSWIGGVLTIAAIGIMIFYIQSTLTRWLDQRPVITLTQDIPDPFDEEEVQRMRNFDFSTLHLDRYTLPPFAVVFRSANLSEQSVMTGSAADPYFSVRFSVKWVHDQDRAGIQSRNVTQFGTRICNFAAEQAVHTEDIGWLGERAYCPDTTIAGGASGPGIELGPVVIGNYGDRIYAFTAIEIILCVGKPECYPIEEILSVLSGGRLYVIMLEAELPTTGGGRSLPKLSYSVLDRLYLIGHSYLLSENIWQSTKISTSGAMFNSDERYLLYLSSTTEHHTDLKPGDTVLASIVFRQHLAEAMEHRVYQTIFDLMGQWSAFFGSIGIGLGLASRWHNERQFYARRPAWDQFNDEFRSTRPDH